MDRSTVVALVVVLDDGFPVGGNFVDDPFGDAQVVEWIVGQLGVASLELGIERLGRLRAEVDPQEASPDIHRHLVEGQAFLAQPVGLVEEWGGAETTVERVGPGVIGALDRAFEGAGRPDASL
jgi:hypothetical protein